MIISIRPKISVIGIMKKVGKLGQNAASIAAVASILFMSVAQPTFSRERRSLSSKILLSQEFEKDECNILDLDMLDNCVIESLTSSTRR